jgi:hypothetical protein
MISTLYHPRPERWPQFTLRDLFILTLLSAVLAATVLPGAVEAYCDWRDGPVFEDIINTNIEVER